MPTNKELEQKVTTLESKLDTILEKLTETKPSIPTTGDLGGAQQYFGDYAGEVTAGKTAEVSPEKDEVTTHVPKAYREAVDTILNSDFKIELEYSDDTPTFGFSILVPKKYSNAAEPHWAMYGEDRRTRMISNADGPAGVKLWVEKVYDNFDMETKAKITSDRLKQYG